jgi:nucleoside phosphorylase
MLNKLKADLANVALKFITVEDKICYMFLSTFPKNIQPIVILPAVDTCMKFIINKLENKTVHGQVVNGKINGINVSVIQTHMGGPATAPIMEALKLTNCKVVIRVDFCGGLKTTIKEGKNVETGLEIGDVVIPKRVFLSDGTSLLYLQQYRKEISNHPSLHEYEMDKNETYTYPNLLGKYYAADCNEKIYNLFNTASENGKARQCEDILWTSDSLCCESESAYNTWKLHGCNSVDMESCAIYLLGALFNIPVISILGVSDLSDCDEYNLFKVNKIHPGMLKSLDSAYAILVKNLSKVQSELIDFA